MCVPEPYTALDDRRPIRRVSGTLAATLAVAASLLVFPSAIPWMIAFWLLIHTWLVWHGRAGWMPLAVCLIVLPVKGIYWTPGLFAFAATASLVGAWQRWAASRALRSGVRKLLPLAFVWLAWLLMVLDWRAGLRPGSRYAVDPSRCVACLGDSLTAFGYPQALQDRLAVPVVDFGRNGITAEDGVRQLPDLLATRPQIVVVELGGHDFLKGKSRAATKRNLEKIIRDCRAREAEVILLEIPRGFIFDGYRGLERQIARQHDLLLVPDTAIRQLVLFSPAAPPGMWLGPAWHLSDDGLHPNRRGNQALAETVAGALADVYGPQILKEQSSR